LQIRLNKIFLLKEQIDEIAAKHPQISVHYSVDKPASDWKGFSGFVNKEVLQKTMPDPKQGDTALVYVCGPPPFMKFISGDKDFTASPPAQGELIGLLKELNFSSNQVYKF